MTTYTATRRWLLHELLRVWACGEINGVSRSNRAERKSLQRRMAKLREEKYGDGK